MSVTDKEAFVARYGGIYEHSPWVAEGAAAELGASPTPGEVRRAMAACVDAADDEQKLALIRAHPDLAGKAALAGKLTEASSDEQASAGLDQCTPAEYEKLHTLNELYKRKFGFPFVMAVRGSSRGEILAAFATRLDNSPELEFATAIENIHRIAALRLEALDHE